MVVIVAIAGQFVGFCRDARNLEVLEDASVS